MVKPRHAVPLLLTLIVAPLTAQARDLRPGARIARIEANIFALSAAGVDSGAPRTITARMAQLKVPGVSVAVFDSGRIIWAKGYGYRDVGRGALVNTETLFQAASISKPVAAAGMLRLVEQGRVSLDADVNTMLTSWRVPASPFTIREKVTLRRIVSHMAGLSVHGFLGYAAGERLPSLPQVLDGFKPANSAPVRVEVTPGEREIYSGGGVTVMQLLMEDVTQRPFDSLMSELVLNPAGMERSTFAQPLPAALRANAASGYRQDGTGVKGFYHTYPERAAAGLWTTPSDLAQFMLAIGRSWRGESNGLLQRGTAREMLTRVPRGSGLGFGLSGSGDAFRYRHNGGNEGFRCYAVAFASIGRGVVVMTNSDAGAVLVNELVSAIRKEYGWAPMGVR